MVFEGDIIIYKDYLDYENDYYSDDLVTNRNYLWTLEDGIVPVPYSISDRIKGLQRDQIAEAINLFHEQTCFRYAHYYSKHI